jgi:hypothetical protein
MGSVHARGDTFLTFGLKALTETNTSRLATDCTLVFWVPVAAMETVISYRSGALLISHLRRPTNAMQVCSWA